MAAPTVEMQVRSHRNEQVALHDASTSAAAALLPLLVHRRGGGGHHFVLTSVHPFWPTQPAVSKRETEQHQNDGVQPLGSLPACDSTVQPPGKLETVAPFLSCLRGSKLQVPGLWQSTAANVQLVALQCRCMPDTDACPPLAPASAGKVLPAHTMARDAPDEVLRPTDDEDYIEYREQTDMREPYR